MNHLAIYSTKAYGEDYIAMMLDGIKTLDSKFSLRRTAPYGKLRAGDYIYLKESSGPIRGRIRVKSVQEDELHDPDQVMNYLAPRYEDLGIRDERHLMSVWESQMQKRYVCQWEIEMPEYASHPVKIQKHDMRSWVVDYRPPEEVMVAFAS